jgi:hypothetical protein
LHGAALLADLFMLRPIAMFPQQDRAPDVTALAAAVFGRIGNAVVNRGA